MISIIVRSQKIFDKGAATGSPVRQQGHGTGSDDAINRNCFPTGAAAATDDIVAMD